jgi:DNA polymerase-3 subunit chi
VTSADADSAASEAMFYILSRRTLEAVLPEMLEKALARGWRVTVRGADAERIAALSSWLWTWRDDAFLPHGDAADGRPERQPIWLTAGPDTPNRPDVLICVDGALPRPDELRARRRTALVIDGREPAAVEAGRGVWRAALEAGCRAEYWAEDERSWKRMAQSG